MTKMSQRKKHQGSDTNKFYQKLINLPKIGLQFCPTFELETLENQSKAQKTWILA